MTKRVRKDAIVSATMSYNMRVLLDHLADARAMSRSEYVRMLVLQDAQETAPRIVAQAAAELLDTKQGRPSLQETVIDSILVDEAKANYGRLVREYVEFLGDDPVGNRYFINIGGEPCIVHNETAYNVDDFKQLSKEDREDIITAVRETRANQDLADESGWESV